METTLEKKAETRKLSVDEIKTIEFYNRCPHCRDILNKDTESNIYYCKKEHHFTIKKNHNQVLSAEEII